MMVLKANFNSFRNDLYWKATTYDEDIKEWFSIRVRGYNDSYWWENVSEKAKRITVKGDKGTEKTFELNYKTLEFVEVKE